MIRLSFLKTSTLLAAAVVALSACSGQSESENTIQPLLPGLESRTSVGFSEEKAKAGLDETLDFIDKIFSEEGTLESITFDLVSTGTPNVAAVPPGELVTSYGDIVPIVALENENGVVSASAYADLGICLFLEASVDESEKLVFRKGVDFSITCNPSDYTEDAIWSDSSWPSSSEVVMPVSPTPLEQGTPPSE